MLQLILIVLSFIFSILVGLAFFRAMGRACPYPENPVHPV